MSLPPPPPPPTTTTTTTRKLRKNFQEALAQLEQHGPEREETYAIDRYWSRLQREGKWFTFIWKCGSQRKSYSDIEKKVVDYGH